MNDWPRFMNNYTARGWQSVYSLPTSIIRFISLSYLGHILFCRTPLVFCFFTFCFSLSLSLFFLIILRVCRSAPWCHFFFFSLHSALHISFFLLSFFLVYTPTPPPRAAHQGFFSDCPGCRRCANWRAGTFVISPLSATEQGAEFKVSPIQ